jgi:hypothetical protein
VTTPETPPEKPASVRPVDYKGEPLDAERGPGLGCFWAQMVLLVTFIVLTPLTVAWNMPSWVSILLLFVTIILLLFSGQTVIFLLRLVASDRREGRRVPLAGSSPTVGEIEDTLPAPDDQGVRDAAGPEDAATPENPFADPATDSPAPAGGHESEGVRE